jgi:hypothetical protein
MGIREELRSAGKKSSTRFFAADLKNVASEIARGLETQYLIGYRSADPTTNGKWREIRVKVNAPSGSPELTVWTKSGYWADKPSGK